MKLSLRRTKLALIVTFPLVAPWVASCARTDDAHATQEDASTTVTPGTDAAVDVDASATPPCDAGDPSCVTELLSCDEADLCPAPSPVDPRHVLTAVWGTSAKDVWAVGSGGTIIHYDGIAWTAVPSDTTDTFHAIWGSGPSDIWIASSAANILHGTGLSSGTAQWTPMLPFTTGTLYNSRMHAVWGASALDVRVGGQPFSHYDDGLGINTEGNQLRQTSTDGGPGWEALSGLDGKWTRATVRAIWGSSATDLWMSLDNGVDEPWARGTLVHGTPSAAGDSLTWTSIDSRSTGVFESLWGSASGDVWAVGHAGAIRHFTAGAKQWAIANAPTSETLHSVWGSGPNDVWAVGDVGTILHFDGNAWTPSTVAFPIGRKPNLSGVWGSGPNDVWVVGEGFTLHFTGKKVGK